MDRFFLGGKKKKIKISARRANSTPFLVYRRDHLRSTLEPGPFAVRDHLRSNLGIISGLEIIFGRGSFAALYILNGIEPMTSELHLYICAAMLDHISK